MIELKFKLWDNHAKTFYDSGFSIDMDGYQWHDDNDHSHYLGDRYQLIQFTGLKDKNGIDIYEGDICEVDNNENANHLQTVNCNYAKTLKKGDILIIKKLLSGYTGQILSNQGEQPNLIGNVCNYSLWNGSMQLKAIGNIYQNSELLTNK